MPAPGNWKTVTQQQQQGRSTPLALPQPTNSSSGPQGLGCSQRGCKHINAKPRSSLVLACHHTYYPPTAPSYPSAVSCYRVSARGESCPNEVKKEEGFHLLRKDAVSTEQLAKHFPVLGDFTLKSYYYPEISNNQL